VQLIRTYLMTVLLQFIMIYGVLPPPLYPPGGLCYVIICVYILVRVWALTRSCHTSSKTSYVQKFYFSGRLPVVRKFCSSDSTASSNIVQLMSLYRGGYGT
jgi:hypothetical protein